MAYIAVPSIQLIIANQMQFNCIAYMYMYIPDILEIILVK